MDDLNDKLARLLSSPDSLSKIQSAMAALSAEQAPVAISQATDNSPAPPPTPSGAPASVPGGLPDLAMLGKIAPLLAGINQDDDDTRLLKALKPYLHGPREQRLEETMQLLRLTKLLPLLQSQGILGGKKQGGGEHGG